jgi:hypothetical protein
VLQTSKKNNSSSKCPYFAEDVAEIPVPNWISPIYFEHLGCKVQDNVSRRQTMRYIDG